MNPVVIGVIVAIIVIAVIFFLKKGKGSEEGKKLEAPPKEPEKPLPEEKSVSEAAPEEEAPPSDAAGEQSEEAPVEEPTEEQPEESTPSEAAAEEAPTSKEEVEIEAAEGVRLDETAEQTAVNNLKEARRERKLQKLRQGLSKTRGGFISKIGAIFKEKKKIDAELLDELEETLITSDVGAATTDWLLTMLREALDKDELADPQAVWSLLKKEVSNALAVDANPWDISSDKPYTIMVVGVNGVGKTTTIGKLASQLTAQGHKIVLAAADTFRAAAVNQLEIWGRRTKCDVVKPAKEGADPSSVVFDAVKKAKDTGADIVIADTAGRLHTQAPLMEELKKISRVMGKAHENAPHEILLVLDATTGQNALQQVKEFGDALGLTSIALTKLDGTAKGGVIIGICHEYKIPVRFIGIGEAKDDLREFDVDDFVDALFLKEESKDE